MKNPPSLQVIRIAAVITVSSPVPHLWTPLHGSAHGARAHRPVCSLQPALVCCRSSNPIRCFSSCSRPCPSWNTSPAARGGPGPSLAVVRNPFAAIALASVFCRYIIYDRTGRTRKWIVYLDAAGMGGGTSPSKGARHQCRCCGWTCCSRSECWASVDFSWRRAVPDAEAKSRYVEQLLNALLFPLGASMVSFGLWATHRVNPVYDGRIYAFEEILGFKFSILGVQVVPPAATFQRLASAVTRCSPWR